MSQRPSRARLAIRAADPSHAPVLHALITANLEEGQLLPRTLDELVVHAERFALAVRPEESSAAPSSRRSARRWPRSDRSPSTRRSTRPRRRGAARRRAAPARAPRRLRQAVRVHARARLLQPDGLLHRAAPLAAREGLHRLREVSAVPALRTVRDGGAARGRHRAASQPACRSLATHDSDGPDSRSSRRHCRAASRRRRASAPRAISAGIKATRPTRPARWLLVSDTPATAAAVFTTNLAAGGAGPGVARASSRVPAASRARSSSTAAARMPAPATTAWLDARAMAAETARLVGCPRRAGARRLDRRHRRRAADGQDPKRAAAARSPRCGSDQGPRGRAGHHDDRSVPEGSRRTTITIGGRETVTIGGMAKGSGMIEPTDGAPMLAFVTTDAAVPQPLLQRALARSRRTTRSTPSPWTASARRTTRVDAARQRRERRRRWTRPRTRVRRGPAGRLPRAGARHRARRRGRDQARHGHGDGRGVRRRSPASPPRPSPTRCSSRRPFTAAIRTGDG